MLPSELLDGLQFHDVALREATAVRRRALGHDEAEMLVHHQRPRMGLQDFRRHADRVDRLVQGDVRVASGLALYRGYPSGSRGLLPSSFSAAAGMAGRHGIEYNSAWIPARSGRARGQPTPAGNSR